MTASSARDLPLFIHLLGAMILVGGVLTAAGSLFVARGSAQVLRMGYFSLLAVALPGYLVMRVGAEWLFAREHLGDLESDPAWIAIGYIVADVGALLLLIALVIGGIGVRRLPSGRTALVRASLAISVILLVASVVAIWAMGAKPA